MGKAIQFFKDAYFELTKVTWLTKKEVVATTFVVIVFVIIMALFVGLVDMILSHFKKIFLSLLKPGADGFEPPKLVLETRSLPVAYAPRLYKLFCFFMQNMFSACLTIFFYF